MKLLCTSLAALAIASAAPAAAQNAAPAAATADAAYPMTPQGAADWVAMVESEMGDFGVEYARVSWVNSTRYRCAGSEIRRAGDRNVGPLCQ